MDWEDISCISKGTINPSSLIVPSPEQFKRLIFFSNLIKIIRIPALVEEPVRRGHGAEGSSRCRQAGLPVGSSSVIPFPRSMCRISLLTGSEQGGSIPSSYITMGVVSWGCSIWRVTRRIPRTPSGFLWKSDLVLFLGGLPKWELASLTFFLRQTTAWPFSLRKSKEAERKINTYRVAFLRGIRKEEEEKMTPKHEILWT